MNGNGNGIVPTVDLATNNQYPFYPMYGNGGFGGAFGGDGIWALVLLALLFGNNNGFGFGGNGGWNNLATTDFVSSEFTQRDISQLATQINNGFQNQSNLITNGFSDNAQNICNLRSDVLTGNMALNNSILENKYANQLAECNTQRDILTQTNQLSNQASVNALNNLAKQEECCCRLENAIHADGEATRNLITQNTIQDLRDRLNNAENVITNQNVVTDVVNAVRPYPTPAWLVSSSYQNLYNGFGWNNFNYGNGFFGNTIV